MIIKLQPKKKDFFLEPDIIYNDVEEIFSNKDYWYVFRSNPNKIMRIFKTAYIIE